MFMQRYKKNSIPVHYYSKKQAWTDREIGFEILMAASTKMTVFWVAASSP
jgi:hypothetical protein